MVNVVCTVQSAFVTRFAKGDHRQVKIKEFFLNFFPLHVKNTKIITTSIRAANSVLFYVLFAIFILHSRESELYRYTLDGKSALAWELPFSRFMGHLSST